MTMADVCDWETDKKEMETEDEDESFILGNAPRTGNYVNWVKAAEGLFVLQQGLAPFVDREVYNMHNLFLRKVPAVVSARCCCTFKNILPDHDISRCTFRNCLCKHHTKIRRRCPNNFCSTFCQLILYEHTTGNPLWRNTDINAWPTDHWSIAKCYMTTPTPSKSAHKTDVSELLSVIINGKFFQHKVASLIGQPGDVFSKARAMQNDIFHRAEMKLTDTELQNVLDTCIAVLKDPVSLLQDNDACMAVKKLESLRNQQLKITLEDETEVLRQRRETLRQQIQEDTIKMKETSGAAEQLDAAAIQRLTGELNDRLRHTEENLKVLKFADSNVGGTVRALKKDTLKQKLPVAADKQFNSEDNDDDLRNTIFDGRSILLKETEKDNLIEVCSRVENLIARGGYGNVYRVTGNYKLQRLKIDLVVKEVMNNQKSVRKEMIVSRILNPFIVPLLGWFRQDEKTSYFVYPFFEKEDLQRVLQECRDSDEVRKSFNAVRRLRVCLQVGYALVYLHTPIPNVREPILHKDVCSQNILVDKNYNARLTDFGMAREENDTTTTASARTAYSHRDVGKGKNSVASKSWDCFAFGVVLREVLTELGPCGVDNTYLKYMGSGLVLTHAKEISTEKGPVWPHDIAETICEVSTRCIETDITENFAEQVKILKQTFDKTECNVVERENDQTSNFDSKTKCDVCMFNKPALRLKQRTCVYNCTQSIQVCMPCEKHSFLNPLTCYTCGCSIKREIGDKCKAILVAGPDSDGNVIEAFNKDVENVKRVFISKAPMIIGISKEDVVEIYSNQGSIAQRIMMTLAEIKDEPVHTLLIYMSCHGQKNLVLNEGNGQSLANHEYQSMKEQRRETRNDNSRQVDRRHLLDKSNGLDDWAEYENNHKFLDKDQKGLAQVHNRPQTNAVNSHSFLLGKETLSFDEFETELGKLSNVKTFVIILDMCHARKLNIENKNVLQINSCAKDQKSRSVSCGSTFTRLFIQGLKGASESFNCCLEQSNGCKLCQRFFRRDDDFTTVENLFRYIRDHMEVKSFGEGERDDTGYPQKPEISVVSDTVNIAYNTNQPVLIEFHAQAKEGQANKQRKPVQIGLEYFTDLAPIQKRLFEEFGRDENKEKMTIKANRYRGDVPEVECDSLEKVMAAWVNRDQLFVDFEQITSEH